MADNHHIGRSIAGKVVEVVPSVLFSAVVYGVPIIYTAGIVAEFVFTTFFKPTKQVRPRAADKNLEGNNANGPRTNNYPNNK